MGQLEAVVVERFVMDNVERPNWNVKEEELVDSVLRAITVVFAKVAC